MIGRYDFETPGGKAGNDDGFKAKAGEPTRLIRSIESVAGGTGDGGSFEIDLTLKD